MIKQFSLCLVDNIEKENHLIIIDEYNNTMPNRNIEALSVNEALYLKDKYFISDEKYHIIRTKIKCNIPSLVLIKLRRKEVNKTFSLSFTNSNKGVFTNLSSLIKQEVCRYLFCLKDDVIANLENEEIRIKLSADGTDIT